MIKIASKYERDITFNLHELEEYETGKFRGIYMNIKTDWAGREYSIQPIPPLKQVVIYGGSYAGKSPFSAQPPYRITEIEESDWEHINKQYAHAYEITNGLIFAEKTDTKDSKIKINNNDKCLTEIK